MPYFFHDNPLSGAVATTASKIVVPAANKLSASRPGVFREGFYYSNTGDVDIILGINYIPTLTKGVVIPAKSSVPFDIPDEVDVYHVAKTGGTPSFTLQEYK